MQQHRIHRLAWMTALAVCLLAALPAVAQKALLDVQANVSPQDVLYFEGTITAKNLTPAGQLQVRNEVDVLVEYIPKGGKFRTLPNRVIPTANESYKGNKLLEGEKLEGRDSTLVKICGEELLSEDEGEALVVTGTVDLADAHRFRIITRLRHQWAGTFPEFECFYDIAGVYPVKAGVARERESKSLLSRAGRFLEHSVCEIGEGIAQVGGQAAGMLLAGGANPIGILQALLLGEVGQQSSALGQALRFIGGAGGAGASTTSLEQVLSGGNSGQANDLTTTLVQGLVARYAGNLTSGGIVGTGAGTTGNQQFDVDDLIDDAVNQLEQDLAGQLGLRNLRVDVDDATAIITSQMPNLEGHGHLEPIIAYMLVDAALAAPWTEAVSAVFESGNGNRLGIAAPAEAARNLARGQIDVQTFLQLCRFADSSNPLLTSGGIAGTGGVPAGSAGSAGGTLIAQGQLPPGWLASGTHTVNAEDLDQIIPGLELSAHSIAWSGMQVVQMDNQAVTVLGLDLGEVGQAMQLAQALENATSGEWDDNLLHLATDPPLHALTTGGRTYLLQGADEPVSKIANLLATGGSASGVTRVGDLMSLLPGLTTSATGPVQPAPTVQPAPQPQPDPEPTEPAAAPETPDAESTPPRPEPSEKPDGPAPAPAPVVPGLPGAETAPAPSAPVTTPPATAEEPPEAVELEKDGYLREAYLSTGVQGDSPVKLEGALPEGTERLGVYLEIKDAPRGSVLAMELVRQGHSLGRRLLGVTGDRRTVAYFAPSGGFSPGQYWLELSEDDRLVTRILFEVK